MAALKWCCHVTAQNRAYRYGRLLCVRRAAGRSTASRQACYRCLAREPLGGLRCFIRGQKVRRAFRHARGSRRASLPERRVLAPGFSSLPSRFPTSARDIAAAHRPYRAAVARRSLSRCFGEQNRPGNGNVGGANDSRANSHGASVDSLGRRRAQQIPCEDLLPLPVGRVPGVGKVTEGKLKGFDVQTIADLRRLDLPTLESRFGRYGVRLYELARGVDASKVVPDRPAQSISAEDTFERDVPLTETEPMIRKLAELTWAASRKESRIARTVVLKLKTAEFKILTRSHTPSSPPSSCEELTAIALSLRERVALGPQQRFRLVGVGLSNFLEAEDPSGQAALFN